MACHSDERRMLQPHEPKPDVLRPTLSSQECGPGSAWSLSIRSFGTGERFSGSNDHRIALRDLPRSIIPVALEGVAPESGDVVVLLGSAAHPERLRVERTNLSARADEPRLLVWLSLPLRGPQRIPEAQDAGRSDSVRGHLTGPAILLEIGAPPETRAKIEHAFGATHRASGVSGIAAELLEQYVRTIAASSDIPVGAAAELVARQTAELAVAAVDPALTRTELRSETVREHRVTAVLAVIDAHCRDPELCPDDVADRVGVSVRYVHRLLESTGVTFGEHVIRARLQLAYRALLNGSSRKIIDVAFDCGFKDVTHFSRRFRASFGMAPREVRGSALTPARVTGSTLQPASTPAVGDQVGAPRMKPVRTGT